MEATDSRSSNNSIIRLSLKTCPICKTHVFDDMDTCYNCMYSFGSNPVLEKKVESDASNRALIGPSNKTTNESDLHKPTGDKFQKDKAGDVTGNPRNTRNVQAGIAEGAKTGYWLEKEIYEKQILEREVSFQYISDYYDVPEDCIKEYEDMLRKSYFEGESCNEIIRVESICDKIFNNDAKSDVLFDEFLVELESFLRKFLLDRKIRI